MPPYRVFVAVDVLERLRTCRLQERRQVIRLFEQMSQDPYLTGDYVERDDIGRPIQVIIIGRQAVCYWADHAVKEVKVIDLRPAGS